MACQACHTDELNLAFLPGYDNVQSAYAHLTYRMQCLSCLVLLQQEIFALMYIWTCIRQA